MPRNDAVRTFIEYSKQMRIGYYLPLENSENYNNEWKNIVKACLDRPGLGGVHTGDIHKKAFKRMEDTFYQEAFLDINRLDSKLRTFAKWKTSIGIERYLIKCQNLHYRLP